MSAVDLINDAILEVRRAAIESGESGEGTTAYKVEWHLTQAKDVLSEEVVPIEAGPDIPTITEEFVDTQEQEDETATEPSDVEADGQEGEVPPEATEEEESAGSGSVVDETETMVAPAMTTSFESS